ncbi:MAG: carbohydrate ABC transporter permease [Mesorhizobium sp.]|nr:MAG: carbohydrate ABC transporter permease [Mesorhizobium sp.]TIU24487.1 MAG: carbohydrate ABC transporter permease [Mesorhizobium sp.]TJX70520.1 MAG: carbohydrate ABC transporter permease [Mesorhizobium sp.]
MHRYLGRHISEYHPLAKSRPLALGGEPMRRDLGRHIYGYLISAAFALFLFSPILWTLSTSLKQPTEMFQWPPVIVGEPSAQHYTAIIADKDFSSALINSIVVSCSTIILTMALSIPAAFGISHLQKTAMRRLLTLVLALRAAPAMIYIIPYFLFFRQVHLVDTKIALIIVNTMFAVPLAIWYLSAFFDQVPREIEEAAMIDGASTLQTMTLISIPIAKYGILATAILIFIGSWNEFLFALTLTRDDAKTAAVAILNFMPFEGTDWGKAAAACVLMLVPIVVFVPFVKKYVAGPTTTGSVKG